MVVKAVVVLQEFLQGPEYVVDQVSCDAVHKTTMVWMYDFQEVNGSRVCVAQRPVSSETKVARELIAYACSCLDDLSIRNGASHTEIIWTSLGPRLVEVNLGVGKSVGGWIWGLQLKTHIVVSFCSILFQYSLFSDVFPIFSWMCLDVFCR